MTREELLLLRKSMLAAQHVGNIVGASSGAQSVVALTMKLISNYEKLQTDLTETQGLWEKASEEIREFHLKTERTLQVLGDLKLRNASQEHARPLELALRLVTCAGRPGDQCSASEFHELANGMKHMADIIDDLRTRILMAKRALRRASTEGIDQ